ncbi:guanylate cyclase 32E-like, partial [Limulus polyphemus]|uniref:Guanylate cyclase 32E-like n=1 Tax=Limulus polyphemus TaxID=6850 RepID=A0ABM1RV36_LIMPO
MYLIVLQVFVVLGYYFEHLGLMISLEDRGLLENGEYFVVGVDIEQYDNEDPRRYLKGYSKLREDVSMASVPAEGAYLYDAVYVYARALNDCLADGQDPFDGKLIFDYMKRRTYQSAMGYIVYMDENGDAEGNYTVIARKPIPGVPGEYGVFRVGVFMLPENSSGIPVLHLEDTVDWVGDGPPKDGPECGFQNEKCV